eukprot:CAMPEP_0177745834 /NCGR_PEP_ID=MMETSP0484_2-20121128/30530_1 /TAXON_ID=354590 /ORGANISM="Rhodomonas lens, Strain RHODO" /LENGTH=95 /DNA_ID=CAMNT_0019260509 /DNA_START=253 /DNA_END=538 /DNA_ORIENTATION=+
MASPAEEGMSLATPEISDEAKKAEVEHFEQVIKAFQYYTPHALNAPGYPAAPPKKALKQKQAVEVNQNFLGTIVEHAKSFICTSQLLHDARTQFA